MKTYTFLPVLTMVFCLFLLKVQLLSAAPMSQSSTDYQQQIMSTDAAVRQQAAQQILQSRQSLQQMLQSTAERAITESYKASSFSGVADKAVRESEGRIYQQQTAVGVSAVELLGETHAETAVPLLVKCLLFQDTRVELGRTPLDIVFPCYGALAKIGLPSLDPLLEQASKTDREVYQRVSVSLVIKVLGPKLAPIYLQDRIVQQKSSAQRKRLEGMADFMKTLTVGPT